MDKDSNTIGIKRTNHVVIKANMVPSFRVIGYYFDQSGKIIADSVWVDVKDECEINVKVSKQNTEIEVSPSEGKNKHNSSPCVFFCVCLCARMREVKNHY